MAQLDAPLPEITIEEFEQSLTRFKLVVTAATKKWDATRQLTNLLTLVQGRLFDYYMSGDDVNQTDQNKLWDTLAK